MKTFHEWLAEQEEKPKVYRTNKTIIQHVGSRDSSGNMNIPRGTKVHVKANDPNEPRWGDTTFGRYKFKKDELE